MPRIDAIPYVVLDANGDPVSGGTVNFFTAGTTTPATVYSDAALSASLGSSVSTNAAGQLVSGSAQIDVYGPAGDYKAVVRNAAGVELATFDNIVVRSDPLTLSEGGTGVQSLTALRDVLSLTGDSDSTNQTINGRFDIWQDGTSFTATGYTADQWYLTEGAGADNTITREDMTLGVSSARYRLGWARATAGTAASTMAAIIEGVRTLQEQTATVTFWVEGDAATEISVRLVQDFGTGGSPSADVTTIISASENVKVSRGKVSLSFDVPSVSGKAVGSNRDDHLRLEIQRPHDATNPTTKIYIDSVSLVQGDATNKADPGVWRNISDEQLLCARFYWAPNGQYAHYLGTATGTAQITVEHPVPMRISPSAMWATGTGTGTSAASSINITNIQGTAGGSAGGGTVRLTIDAIKLNARITP